MTMIGTTGQRLVSVAMTTDHVIIIGIVTEQMGVVNVAIVIIAGTPIVIIAATPIVIIAATPIVIVVTGNIAIGTVAKEPTAIMAAGSTLTMIILLVNVTVVVIVPMANGIAQSTAGLVNTGIGPNAVTQAAVVATEVSVAVMIAPAITKTMQKQAIADLADLIMVTGPSRCMLAGLVVDLTCTAAGLLMVHRPVTPHSKVGGGGSSMS